MKNKFTLMEFLVAVSIGIIVLGMICSGINDYCINGTKIEINK